MPRAITAESMLLTEDETALLADAQFFRKKAAITAKIRGMLEATHAALQKELAGLSLVVPPGFDPHIHQLVKGEHLEEFPYQYLDYPKHFSGVNKFTFRTLVWWGHHAACALLLEVRRSDDTSASCSADFIRSPEETSNCRWHRHYGSGNAGRAIRCRSPMTARLRLPPCWLNDHS